ncbi:MAG: pilus assembly protein PilP [Bdellovibrionales bacterium]|nr:pilus assembly protein PilP [Bdellovibrionales bacterium]
MGRLVSKPFLLFMMFVFVLASCSSKEEAPSVRRKRAAKKAPPANASPQEQVDPLAFLKSQDQTVFYNPHGRRDPFKPFEGEAVTQAQLLRTPLERFEINQLELTAIVWGISKPRALFRAPDTYSYIASTGTRLGRNRGQISKITRHKVLILEEYRDPTGKLVVRESEFRISEEGDEENKDRFKSKMELKFSDE